jgi:hypothetical protein
LSINETNHLRLKTKTQVLLKQVREEPTNIPTQNKILQNISKDSAFSFTKIGFFREIKFENFSISKNNIILCQSSQWY